MGILTSVLSDPATIQVTATGPSPIDMLHAWQTTLVGVVTAVGGLVWAAMRAYGQYRDMKRKLDLEDAKARVEIAQADVQEATAEVEALRIRKSSPDILSKP